jgi:hypothetical protein
MWHQHRRYRETTSETIITREGPMKERRVRCKTRGQRFTVVRFERERTSAYCDLCRAERKREQTRERVRRFRAFRPLPPTERVTT